MEFNEVVKKRRSIRHYTDEKVPREILVRILDAARLAPTWANMQGCRYIIVENTDIVTKLHDAIGQKWCKSAGQFIVLSIKPRKSGKSPAGLEYYLVDAGICMEHIVLAATNEGLGTCWIGYFDEKKVKEVLKMPKRSRVIAITPIGHAKRLPKRKQERKSIEEIVYVDEYGKNLK